MSNSTTEVSMTNKHCYKCKETKPIELFCKNHRRADGHDSLCKTCKSIIEAQRRKDNNAEYTKRDKVWKVNHPIYVWADTSLRSHRKKGNVVDITTKELVNIATRSVKCELCNCDLDWTYGTKSGKLQLNSPTLDRIDNENFINKNNIMILCHSCNATKRNRTLKEFHEYCKMITDNIAKRPCIDRLHTDRDVCKGTTDSPKVALA